MDTNRREFLSGAAFIGATAMAAGCIGKGSRFGFGGGGSMHGYTCEPLKTVRVGFIGVGGRGMPAVERISQIPGCTIAAVSDINPVRLDKVQAYLKSKGLPPAKEFSRNGNEDAWKGLCDYDGCDVVYSCTPRPLHCPINVYAMSRGKHVMQEVPGVFSLDECWETVEAAEKFRRHCYMMENCCYGEAEMLALNLAKKGKLGEIMQAEVGYTHDQRALQYRPHDGRFWRIDRHMHHHGNYYPTHGLVPAGKVLDINRGDRFEYLVSSETASRSFEDFGRENFPTSDWRHTAKMVKGDVNMCILKTAKGKNLVLKHNVCTPTPYDRGSYYLGTRGCFSGIFFPKTAAEAYQMGSPCRFGWLDKTDAHVGEYFSFEKMSEYREQFKHPFWKAAGAIAQKVGGHGGMDFIMDLRWVYCLQNGLPMDTDVYDLATYSSIVELSERSVNAGSEPIEFPDYTRGGWKTAKPFAIDEIDIGRFDFKNGVSASANAQRT